MSKAEKKSAEINHGTTRGYRRGCRCAECRAAVAAAGVIWRAEHKDRPLLFDDLTAAVRTRFWARVDKDGPVPTYRPELGPCWIWTGALANRGSYGIIGVRGSKRSTHRVSHLLAAGSLPPAGFDLDHLCRVPACVRPDHLEAVTHRENLLRGMSPSAIATRSNSCIRGHEFTPESTHVRADGRRYCRTCARDIRKARVAQKKAA